MRLGCSSMIRSALLPLLLAACSSSQAPADPNAKAAVPTACTMLDAAQMSAILGETLTAEPHDEKFADLGHSECHYFGARHDRFRIMVSVQRQNVAGFVNGLKIPARGPVTPADPYADLGQGAKAFGPMLYVITEGGLIGISSPGLFVQEGDPARRHAIAEQILAVLAPRLAAERAAPPSP